MSTMNCEQKYWNDCTVDPSWTDYKIRHILLFKPQLLHAARP